MKLFFNETSTSTLTIQSSNANGISNSTLGITAGTLSEFQSNASLDTRLGQLRDALNAVRSQSSAFGADLSIVQNRQDFSKNMINTLQVGSDALVLADTNEEAADLLALQTRQQLSTTALSLANQSAAAVLRLSNKRRLRPKHGGGASAPPPFFCGTGLSINLSLVPS